MAHQFTFYKGRQNTEKLRVNIDDPINGESSLNPDNFDKLELIVGDVVIASPGEITWEGDVISIKPSLEHLNSMTRSYFSELVAYDNGESVSLSSGHTIIGNA